MSKPGVYSEEQGHGNLHFCVFGLLAPFQHRHYLLFLLSKACMQEDGLFL